MFGRVVATRRRAKQTRIVDLDPISGKIDTLRAIRAELETPSNPILWYIASKVPNGDTRLLDRVSRQFCACALSCNGRVVVSDPDSGFSRLVPTVRAVRGFCADLRALESSSIWPGVSGATSALFRLSRQFCACALSCNGREVGSDPDSGGSRLVPAVRTVRGLCAYPWKWLLEFIEEI